MAADFMRCNHVGTHVPRDFDDPLKSPVDHPNGRIDQEQIEMAIGNVGSGSSALELVRSAMAGKSTQAALQVQIAGKALDVMRAEGEATVQLIDSTAPHLGQHVNVRA